MGKKILSTKGILASACLLALLFAASAIWTAKSAGHWTITQYGSSAGQQKMFYTLADKRGHLIVVDGGWPGDAAQVRNVINMHGKHVDLWILTHPHQDHIQAFMEIYEDPRGIQIDRVLAPQMPSLALCQENASWDEFGTYERFLAMDIPELEYVKPNDTYQVGNLSIDILSAYEDKVDELSNDLINDGSIMFRVKGDTQSMLFCADVGKSMSKYLVKKYGDDLKSDYLQMGHHGNGGLKKGFYQKVAPKVAFFDAPNWLFYDESGTYTTPKNRKIMEELGSKIYHFRTAPNTVILK